MQKSLFIVSLDFELLWGMREYITIERYGANISGVRQVIPALLELFKKYGVSATFATVGLLFARNKEELLQHRPTILPDYTPSKYSPYENNYFSRVGKSEEDDIYHYAGSLIRMILQSPEHEIASHTFSHYYCLANASIESFEADMQAARTIAATYGVTLKSVVFPRNQYSARHIAICQRLGFIAYRGNPQSFIYKPTQHEKQSEYIRALRLADSYVNLTGHHTFNIEQREGIINIPASRFLRPAPVRLKVAEDLRLNRIRRSMSVAAAKNQCYHLWWHPHNFGVNLERNLAFLEKVLKHYEKLNSEFGMQSKTMKAIAEERLKPYDV